MKKTLLLFLGLSLSGAALHAQSVGPSVLDATGGSATISGNTYEYAVGDVTNGATLTSPTLIVTQGVLQPTKTTGINNNGAHPITGLDVYPSPVATTLYLQPHFSGSGRLSYSLYDAGGKLVLTKEAILATGTERQEASVEPLAVGQYTLQVQWLEGSNTLQSAYKIQKLR